ncbi:MAG: hypothetical protein ACP5HM_04395 [Anaerolineae bacterium]
MVPHDTILLVTGLTGALSLLALQVFTRRHIYQKTATAFWLTLMAGLWLVFPREGRWLLSFWSPSTILPGRLLMEMTPAVWSLGLALGLGFAGVAWVAVADARPALPLSGVVTLGALLTVWLALTGGTVLTVLAAWTLFDLLWGAAGLIAVGDGERVIFGWLFHGLASLILWMVTLLLEQEGGSALWGLMVPSSSIVVLLIGAAVLRIALYPFHITFPRRLGRADPLFAVVVLGPVVGLGLLYRVLALPGEVAFPPWLMGPALVTVLWGGVWVWRGRGSEMLLWVAYALLGLLVAGALVTRQADVLLYGTAAWWGGWTSLWLSRPRHRTTWAWSWPGWIAMLFLIGVPPSPLGVFYRSALATQGWVRRGVLLVGGALVTGGVLAFVRRATSRASVSPPWVGQQLALGVGLALPLGGLISGAYVEPFWIEGLFFWGAMVLLGALAVRGVKHLRIPKRVQTAWSLLDVQWVHRALWRGAEHLLGVVRVVADVVEGSGALLWSLLVILIVLLVRGS